jgi:hypothetical protein
MIWILAGLAIVAVSVVGWCCLIVGARADQWANTPADDEAARQEIAGAIAEAIRESEETNAGRL